MALSYEYDESDETWPFFLLTILFTVLVPATIRQIWKLLPKGQDDSEQKDNAGLTGVENKYVSDEIKQYRKDHQKKSILFSWQTISLAIGWAVLWYLVQRISNSEMINEQISQLFDPYELLNVATSATDREVRSAYRRLSVQFHPDKLGKDLSAEERTQMEEQYVLITKAYKALTDEVTRNNYLKYGHPDGPQSTSHGIALPKFLIEGSMSPMVVIGYILLLAVVLPYFVSRWWANTQSYTAKGLNTETASYFVGRLFNNKPSEVITFDTIIKWLSHAKEFRVKHPQLTPDDFAQLFHDHIHRKHSGPLEKVKLDIVAKSTSLLHGMLEITTSFRNTEVANAILDTSKSIIQATPVSPHAQILQLPNVDREVFIANKVDDIRTLGKLFTYPDEEIGKILGIKDESALKDTLKVASNIPHLKVIHAEFKVPGEVGVTPHSTPHIVLKVIVRSAKHKIFPPDWIPESKLQEPQDFQSLRDPFAMIAEQPVVPQTFAPYFPVTRKGGWCCLVALQKDAKVIQTPLIVTRLSFENLNNDFDKRKIKELNKESFNPDDWVVGTIKIPLGQPAPAETGEYFIRVIIKSTEYFGGELDLTMPMVVRDPASFKKSAAQIEKEAIYGDSKDNDTDTQDNQDDNLADSDEENDDDDDDDDDQDPYNDEDESGYTDIDTDTEVEEDAKE